MQTYFMTAGGQLSVHLAAGDVLGHAHEDLDAGLVLPPLVVAAVDAQVGRHLDPLPLQGMAEGVPRLQQTLLLLLFRTLLRVTSRALRSRRSRSAPLFDPAPAWPPSAFSLRGYMPQLHSKMRLVQHVQGTQPG